MKFMRPVCTFGESSVLLLVSVRQYKKHKMSKRVIGKRD